MEGALRARLGDDGERDEGHEGKEREGFGTDDNIEERDEAKVLKNGIFKADMGVVVKKREK